MESVEKINDYVNAIIQIAFDNLPIEDGWSKFDINVVAIKMMVTMSANYYTEDNKRVSFNPKHQSNPDKSTDLTFIFLDLRNAMYQLNPEKGAWFSCKIEVDNDGKFVTSYNYDDKPDFTYWPTKEKFIDDLKKYPRSENLIPEWLKKAMKGEKMK